MRDRARQDTTALRVRKTLGSVLTPASGNNRLPRSCSFNIAQDFIFGLYYFGILGKAQ